MKKLILIAVITLGALVTSGPVAQAADADAPAQKGKGRADRLALMKTELNLTDAQVTALKPIMEKNATEMQKIRQNSDLSREERAAKSKTLSEAFAKEIKPILTSEQFTKWEKLNADRMQKRKKAQ
jgi:periplasmic protein CpxP/Spy